MCCKKRSKPSDDLLTEMASGKDPESAPSAFKFASVRLLTLHFASDLEEPLRKKKKRSSRRRVPSSDEETTTTESSGSSDDDSKKRR